MRSTSVSYYSKHNELLVLTILLYLAGLFSTLVYAQEPTAVATTVATPSYIKELSAFDRKINELALVEYELLGQRRLINLSDEIRAQSVFALEKLVTFACMPKLSSTLKYEGPAQGEDCLKYLTKLKELHQNNPIALCAEHGLNSESCLTAFNEQYITSTPLSDSEKKKLVNDYIVKIWASSLKNMKLTLELYSAESKYQSKPNENNKQLLLQAWRKELALTCDNINFSLVNKEPLKQWQAGYVEVVRKEDPLAKLISEYDSKKPKEQDDFDQVPSATEELEDYAGLSPKSENNNGQSAIKFWRIRHIPEDCFEKIKLALEVDINFSDAICIKEGFHAPNCIKSKILEQNRLKKLQQSVNQENKTGKSKQSAFTTF